MLLYIMLQNKVITPLACIKISKVSGK